MSLLLFSLCYFKAMDYMSLSNAAILLYTAPCFVILFSALLFKEKITARKLAAMLIAFTGCCLVSGIGAGSKISTTGILFGLGSGICYALFSIFSRFAINRGYSTFTINFYTCLLAGVVSPILGTEVITELSAVGGVVFIGMGINMTGITDRKINISNLIPALIIPIIYMPFSAWIGGLF